MAKRPPTALNSMDDLEDLVLKLSDHLTALEKNHEADKEDDCKLVTRIANFRSHGRRGLAVKIDYLHSLYHRQCVPLLDQFL